MRTLFPATRLLSVISVLAVWSPLFGCDGASSRSIPTGPAGPSVFAPPATTFEVPGGYFAGSVQSGEESWYGEAMVTTDGAVRIFIQGPSRLQFVGTLTNENEGKSLGEGLLIGEDCHGAPSAPFCNQALAAEIVLSRFTGEVLLGEIQLTAEQPEQRWTISMSWPTDTYAELPATLPAVEGVYVEVLAAFAHEGDVVVTVSEGRLFFQSAHSGCVGNGNLRPRGDGAVNVYDVELLIEGCDATYESLNGSLVGLATRSIGGWDWGDWLVMWLSSPDDAGSKVALTMWSAVV